MKATTTNIDSIKEFRDEYSWLSNFAPVSVKLDNVFYPSIENAYQAAKVLDPNDRRQFQICSASQAKKLSKMVKIRDDWDNVKLLVMRHLCQQKFRQQPYKSKLIATGNAELEEGNSWGDNYWGVCNGHGLNYLGKLITDVRTELLDIMNGVYTCLCEDEYYKENCSQECDLCDFGHTEQKPCSCYNCAITEE